MILIIRAEADRPPTDEEQLKTMPMLDFISSIDMKVFMGPYVKYLICQATEVSLKKQS